VVKQIVASIITSAGNAQKHDRAERLLAPVGNSPLGNQTRPARFDKLDVREIPSRLTLTTHFIFANL
jgi:hypothetical protein